MTYTNIDKANVNREYKDRLFKFIFGNPENKEWTLSLYNSINHSSYTDSDDIKLTTIEDAVYLSMKNDISFLAADTMNFYEQQSTFNPNMPMRFLIYAGMVFDKFAEENKSYHKYSSKQQKAPTPKCVCFYNGISEKEDIVILKLSDSFESELKSDIEVYVTMININYGHNKDLMEACNPLSEYSWFVDNVRTKQKSKDGISKAIDEVIDAMPNDWLIKPFLIANRAEVKHMCITEYNEERTLAETREDGKIEGITEGIAIGREEGIEIGILTTLISLVKKGILTLSQAAEQANMSVAEFERKARLAE